MFYMVANVSGRKYCICIMTSFVYLPLCYLVSTVSRFLLMIVCALKVLLVLRCVASSYDLPTWSPCFHMETSWSALRAIHQDNWMVSIDMKDAYPQVLIHPQSCKYLWFVSQGRLFQLKVLCFGLMVRKGKSYGEPGAGNFSRTDR